jgi:hypothetical protein
MSNPTTPNLGSSPQSDANSTNTQRRNSSVQPAVEPPAPSNPTVNDVHNQSPQRQGILRGAVDLEEDATREQEKRARIEKFERIWEGVRERILGDIDRGNKYVKTR